ncbi:MAG: polysaccharide deacetylase family protein, partial [bacterium]
MTICGGNFQLQISCRQLTERGWRLLPRLIFFATLGAWLNTCPAQDIIIDNTAPGYSSTLGIGVPILYYHNLDEADGHDPNGFWIQMNCLYENNFETISLDHLTSWILTGAPPLPPKPIILTFDDDYESVYTVAFPAFEAYGFIGYNFAKTGYVGLNAVGVPLGYHFSTTIFSDGFNHCTWDQIVEMEEAGVIFTESHSVYHWNMATLPPAAVDHELLDSKAAIEAHIPNKTVRHFAYPFGTYNQEAMRHVRDAGYTTAGTTIGWEPNRRSTPLLELRRNWTSSGTLDEFLPRAYVGLVNQSWRTSTADPACFGTDYESVAAGRGGSVAMWKFTPAISQTHEVFAWLNAGVNHATNAPYTIRYARGQTTVRVNQTAAKAGWMSLGQYPFQRGGGYSVTLTDDADATVTADAIRISPRSGVITGPQVKDRQS